MINKPTGFRLNDVDKAALRELTQRLQMKNRTETVRALVHETLAILKERDAQHQSQVSEPAAQNA